MNKNDRRWHFLEEKDALRIRQEVSAALETSLDYIRDASVYNYTLLLASADYRKCLEIEDKIPFTINDMEDRRRDKNHITIHLDYLNQAYSTNSVITEDCMFNVFLELSLYTQTLESGIFTRTLFRIFSLLNDEEYPWRVQYDGMGGYRKKIDDLIKKGDQSLGNVFNEAVSDEIRNSFDHNDYEILFDQGIILYNEAKCKLQQLTLYNWTEMFLYLSELYIQLYNKLDERRQTFEKEIAANAIEIELPEYKGEVIKRLYRFDNDDFHLIPCD